MRNYRLCIEVSYPRAEGDRLVVDDDNRFMSIESTAEIQDYPDWIDTYRMKDKLSNLMEEVKRAIRDTTREANGTQQEQS